MICTVLCQIFLFLLLLPQSAQAATAAEWRSRSIYQVLTDRFARSDVSTTANCDASATEYCDGTWTGLIHKLDYIKNMGFTAVWVSPVTQQLEGHTPDGSSYHGYWQININALNPHFGAAGDLKALSAALHDRNMYLMVDIVPNHFAWRGTANTINYSTFVPFNNAEYFHKYCRITDHDYDHDQTRVENCWLGSDNVELPDLDTSREDVKEIWYAWIKSFVKTYNIDGLRIDTLKHVQKDFWPEFADAAGVYAVGEVAHSDSQYTCPYQDVVDGLLNYPLWYAITDAFKSPQGSMKDLAEKTQEIKDICFDSTLLANFLENHDQPRFPSHTQDPALIKNAIAFTMLGDGIPIIYQGQEQGYSGEGPFDTNREAVWLSGYKTEGNLYQFIAVMNHIRNWASEDLAYLTHKALTTYHDSKTIITRKGQGSKAVIGVFSNGGSHGTSREGRIGGFAAGADVVEILSCEILKADPNGAVPVLMGHGDPKILHATDGLQGSGICNF